MIRSQKTATRNTTHHHPSSNDIGQSSTNSGDPTSYIGKILNINHNQVTVEHILGQGGFAFVFLVRSSSNQQRYALKRMYVNNQHDLDVCQREISILKEFSTHLNIIKYVDSYVHRLPSTNLQRRHYHSDNIEDSIHEILLLTEYCSNGTLINCLNEQKALGITLSEREILRIFVDICHAVSACHFRCPQPILHRDIKLENILIDSRQNYVLCDFGSAIFLSSSSNNYHKQYETEQLTTNMIQQIEEDIQRYTTLSYRAPEMIDLYSRIPITLKSDIWAMGCLLYKLMYNVMPFGESILAIQNGTFVIPDDMANVYSRDLNVLVRYILEIDIHKRPDIWQVSYVAYKLLAIECPIPNRYQSKVPDLSKISMPLTDSEFRQQRINALSKTKISSTTVNDDSLSSGTAVNPRERPRGMNSSSVPMINFNQINQRSSTNVSQQQLSSNSSRSDPTVQLMFDDDFSKMSTDTINLTNVSTGFTKSSTNPSISEHDSKQHTSPSMSNLSSSLTYIDKQTTSNLPSNNSFNQHETSNNDYSQLNKNLNQLKLEDNAKINSQSNFESEQNSSLAIDHNRLKENITKFQANTEYEKTIESDTNQYERRKQLSKHSNRNSLNNFDDRTTYAFGSFVNENADSEQKLNNIQSELPNSNNPFLHAPFHCSPVNKRSKGSSIAHPSREETSTNSSSFDAHGIIYGQRKSAFVPFQGSEANSDGNTTYSKHTLDDSVPKFPHSETFPPILVNDQLSISTDVFTNAPFKHKSSNKQRSTITNRVDLNENFRSYKKPTASNVQFDQEHAYSNTGSHDKIIDECYL